MTRQIPPTLPRLARIALLALVPHWAFAAGATPGQPARPDLGELKSLIETGRSVASFCANCHGAAGISKYPEVPNLAGQNAGYLLRQVDAFASGKRQSEFMNGLMKLLSPREREGLARYYASLNVVPSAAKSVTGGAAGAASFARICARCHGDDALGDERHPRLAGQQPEYLRLNMQRYYTPTKVRFYAPMTAAMMQLGRDNMEVVVQYLSSLDTN